MKKFLVLLLTLLPLFAIDYADRSTQELIAALARAKGANVQVILHELEKRVLTMTPKEREAYEKARKKLEHAGEN